MPEQDDFGAELGSMDRNQLQALLNEIQNRYAHDPLGEARGNMAGAPRPGGAKDMGQAFGAHYKDTDDAIGMVSSLGLKTLESAWDGYKSIGKRKKAKKAQAEYDRQMAEARANQKKILGERGKMVQNQMKTLDLRSDVDRQFRDMELGGLFDGIVKQGLDKSLLGIQQQHGDLARETGFMAVGQGLGGSSVDAERSADISASQNQAVAQAAAQAQGQKTQLHSDLDNQRRQLLSSISGGNPGEQARLTGELQNIQNNASSYGQQLAGQTYGMGQNAGQLAGQSQALGGLLSNYAKLYNQNPG